MDDENDEDTIQKDLAERLIAALRSDGFVLYAQPIIALADAAAARPMQEILTRFREEEEKLIPPGTFFPLLEEYGLVPYLDRWVVSRLAHWVRAMRKRQSDWPAPCNSVNLAADTLHDPKFADYVRKHISKAELAEETLIFELSWDTALRERTRLRELAAELKPAGCRFTLAGFDGSAESFALVEELAPDFVKLSYALVRELERALAAAEALERVQDRCRGMRVRTIAEFVESKDLLEHLRAIGVDFAQGLGIAPPRKLR